MSEQWGKLRGLQIVAFGVNTIKASEEDEQMIKEMQKTAVLRNPNMAAATLAGAQAEAMKAAASNTATGPMMAFAGMNMATQAGGMDANSLFAMGAQQKAGPALAERREILENSVWNAEEQNRKNQQAGLALAEH